MAQRATTSMLKSFHVIFPQGTPAGVKQIEKGCMRALEVTCPIYYWDTVAVTQKIKAQGRKAGKQAGKQASQQASKPGSQQANERACKMCKWVTE